MKLDLFNFSLITPVNADAGFGGEFGFMIPMVLIFGIMYFLLFRPQQKRAQELKKMRDNLKRGDRVLMNGGMYGEVAKVIGPEEVLLEISEGVKVRVATSLIGSVISGTASSQESSPSSQKLGIEPAPAATKKPSPAKSGAVRKSATKKTSTVKGNATKKASSTAKTPTAKKTTARKAAAKKTTVKKTAEKKSNAA